MVFLFSLIADSASFLRLKGNVLVRLRVVHDLNRDIDACDGLPQVVDVE